MWVLYQRCAPCLLKSMHGTLKRSNPKKNISMICDNKCCDDTIVLKISCSVYSWSMDASPKELFGSLQFLLQYVKTFAITIQFNTIKDVIWKLLKRKFPMFHLFGNQHHPSPHTLYVLPQVFINSKMIRFYSSILVIKFKVFFLIQMALKPIPPQIFIVPIYIIFWPKKK